MFMALYYIMLIQIFYYDYDKLDNCLHKLAHYASSTDWSVVN